MTPEQNIGVGALMVIGAIVVGYVVSCVVPKQHFPRTAGLLSADALIAGLAAVGIEPAAYVILGFAFLSLYPGMYLVMMDFDDIP